MKKTVILIVILLAFSACFNTREENEGTIILNLGGGGSGRAALPWPPDDGIKKQLNYAITLSGNGESVVLTVNGTETVRVSVAAGRWNVQVDAYYQNDGKRTHYAAGSNYVDVQAGKNNKVTITMRHITATVCPCADGGDCICGEDCDCYCENCGKIPDFVFPLASIPAVRAYLAVHTGTLANPVDLPVGLHLGTMAQEGSGWKQLLDVIAASGDYVHLDLSAAAMDGTVFAPDSAASSNGKNRIVSITVPDMATNIGRYAFADCNNLQRVQLPEGLMYIDNFAFSHCANLKEILMPDGMTGIGGGAFAGCGNLSLTALPTGLTYIGEGAFVGCVKLTLTALPESLTFIGADAFARCNGLTRITLPAGLETIHYGTFSGCTSLERITLPNSLTSIGGFAFSDCWSLKEIHMPDGITSIGENAFARCDNLTLTSLPKSLTSIGKDAFLDCVTITLTALPDRVAYIGDGAFARCANLALTALSADLIHIGINAFIDCSNITLTALPDGVTRIRDGAFAGCSNIALSALPNGVTFIGHGAFNGCTKLILTALPDALTFIGSGAFLNCHSLTMITLPKGLTEISGGAFNTCVNLSLVTFLNPEPAFTDFGVFDNTHPQLLIRVPAEGFQAYLSNQFMNAYADRISLNDGRHQIITVTATDGYFIVSHSLALAGETVTLTLIPDYGFNLVRWVLSPDTIVTSDAGGGVYTFIMPDTKVTVSAVFHSPFIDLALGKGGYAVASSNSPWNIFSNAAHPFEFPRYPDYGYTEWQAHGESDSAHWLAVDLGTMYDLGVVRITWGRGGEAYEWDGMTAFVIQVANTKPAMEPGDYSDDGWTTVGMHEYEADYGQGDAFRGSLPYEQVVNLETGTIGRYIRIKMVDPLTKPPAWTNWPRISGFEVYQILP